MAETPRCRIVLTATAEKALAAVKDVRVKAILSARIDKLTEEPEKQGKPLSSDLAGRRGVCAVGQQYRILYQVQQEIVVVSVLMMGLRKESDKQDVYVVAERVAHGGALAPLDEGEQV